MPKTLGGLVSFAITSVITVVVGLWIVNRVPFVSALISGRKAG